MEQYKIVRKYKVPFRIVSKLKQLAPSCSSGTSNRRFGYYGDDEYEGRGYNSVLLYIQNGLGNYRKLIKEIVRMILNIQEDTCKTYQLLPFGFGNTKTLQHEKKHFKLGYARGIASVNISGITDVILRISDAETVTAPAIIPELFPKVDIRSLYHGKTRVDRDDLLIVIGKKDEVHFNKEIENKLTFGIKKHLLFVEIDGEEVEWFHRDYEYKFFNMVADN
ncbi:MAG: hypothetical protein K8R79_01680 [Calditrichales bacterium]|nr:hypothetical protein [Calditrichales bacterium]